MFVFRSDALSIGDNIVSVNGIRTSGMKHDEVINLIKNAEDHVILEVEYQLPDTTFCSSHSVQSKQHEIVLERDGSSFGFTLRGGYHELQHKARPLVVTNIRPGGPADREGSMKIGDRILAVNDYNVAHFSLSEVSRFLHASGDDVELTLEYDVSIMDVVRNAQGPLLVEIDKPPGCDLGIGLAQTSHKGVRCLCVESVHPMSTADRCGAVNIGDHILCIDGCFTEHMSIAEANQLLRSNADDMIKLEILPVRIVEQQNSRDSINKNGIIVGTGRLSMPSMSSAASFPALPSSLSTPLGLANNKAMGSTISSAPFGSNTLRRSGRKSAMYVVDRKQSSCMSISSTATSVMVNNQVCHSETVDVPLVGDSRGIGLIIDSSMGECLVVSAIVPGGVAERCGVIQEGDRIVSYNGQDVYNMLAEDVNKWLREPRQRCELQIEFDVTESVMPSSGVFIVKLPNYPKDIGLSVNVTRNHDLTITNVKKGSIAYRCGSLQRGDKILAIGDHDTEGLSLDEAMLLLQSAEDIIKLKLRREEKESDEINDDSTVYTVELQRRGGPLGITISGTDNPGDPIVISDIIPKGLADRTGAIHIGDLLLAINNMSTKGRTLTEATVMLQNAGDLVNLKIARPQELSKLKSKRGLFNDRSTTKAGSVDSAMESWDSLLHDTGNYGNHASGHNLQGTNMSVAKPAPRKQSSKSSKSVFSSQPSNSICASRDRLTDLSYSDTDWDNLSNGSHSNQDYGEGEALEWVKKCQEYANSEMLQQISQSLQQKSTASLDRRSRSSDGRSKVKHSLNDETKKSFVSEVELQRAVSKDRKKSRPVRASKSNAEMYQNHVKTIFSPSPVQLHKIKLVKVSPSEDFGFGLSDGMYEKGVYISGVREGSIADMAGLRQFDRILQINGKRTRDFDCSLTIPLIAEAGSKMSLIVSRNPVAKSNSLDNRKTFGVQPFREYRSCDENHEYSNISVVSAEIHSPKSV
ncbi:hypothetical protein FSP39_024955 [Pinctada imbricata]|uniref:PDZ domain-containing protein n=1 Tax=Pinctada imbricata TaxID=66713 RepID=A0AA88YFB5_PINIB|nr:hypothetical protein FSP39_024955 [Pinctada imbricata]